jgi:hypothetical protein
MGRSSNIWERGQQKIAFTKKLRADQICGMLAFMQLKIFRLPYCCLKTYATVILLVVLCGYTTFSLGEEHTLRAFENRVLKKIFGLKRYDTGGLKMCLMRNSIISKVNMFRKVEALGGGGRYSSYSGTLRPRFTHGTCWMGGWVVSKNLFGLMCWKKVPLPLLGMEPRSSNLRPDNTGRATRLICLILTPPNTVRMIKSGSMRCADHIARMGDIRSVYRILL